MANTKLKYIKYTKQELDKYVLDKGSCVNLINSDMHISFPPWGFSNFQETVTNIISRSKIGKFDTKMDGIVLDVRNIKVFGTSYAVHDDDPYNHINLNANFYVFQPRLGAIITGVVKHISHRHVAAIIYRVFNVSIRFKKPPNNKLEINKNIKVKIKKFDLQDGLPYIEGELIEDAIGSVKRKIFFDEDEDEVENTVDSGISTEETSAKRRKIDKTAATSGDHADKSSSSSGSSSDSDTDDGDGNGMDINDIKGLLFDNVKIKKEKLTDDDDSSSESDEELEDDKKKLQISLNRQQQANGDDSDSSSDGDDANTAVAVKQIKKEKDVSSDSAESDSESDSEGDNVPTAAIKTEKNVSSDESSDSNDARTSNSVPIKQEPISTDDSDSDSDNEVPTAVKLEASVTTSNQNGSLSTKSTKKQKRNVSFSDQLDNLLNETLQNGNESGKKRKNESKTVVKSSDYSPGNKTLASVSQIASPAMSSALKSATKSGKKKAKDVSLLDSMVNEALENSLRELEDASSEVQPTHDSSLAKKRKSASKKDKSLKAMEDDLFSSFLS